MPAIPLPFVLALLLGLLLARLLLGGAGRSPLPWRHPASLPVAVCALLVLLTGVHWSVGLWPVSVARQLAAASLPPLAWLSLNSLRQPGGPARPRGRWPHLAGPFLVMLMAAAGGPELWLIDPLLGGLAIGYGLAMLRSGAGDADRLVTARLADLGRVRQAVWLAGLLLCGAGLVDWLIAIDFGLYGGSHAPSIVALSHLPLVPLIAVALVIMGRGIPAPATPPPEPAETGNGPADPDHEQDGLILARLDQAMRERRLHHDPDLTLDRLARRTGIPTRRISGAVNRRLGRNVSQLVNEYRIADAMALLRDSDLPVTTVMLECGFQTKSNFNREFTRVTGTSPSRYRSQARTMPAQEN